MKTVFVLLILLLPVSIYSQTKWEGDVLTSRMGVGQTPKAVVPPAKSANVKMPEVRSIELKALQTQADKIKGEYDTVMKEIQLRAAALINRAALEARMTAEQLDAMDLALDDKGNYEWRPKPPPAVTKNDAPAATKPPE